MTLEGLRQHLALLAHLPGDTPVILAKDAEGNGFSPLIEAEHAMYLADTTYSGEHYLTDEARAAEEDPDDYSAAPVDAVHAVFLWPVN
jgi:hypothetical protein